MKTIDPQIRERQWATSNISINKAAWRHTPTQTTEFTEKEKIEQEDRDKEDSLYWRNKDRNDMKP